MLRATGHARMVILQSAFRGWVRVRVLGNGFGVKGRKVKSSDCALASDLVRAIIEHLSARVARSVGY